MTGERNLARLFISPVFLYASCGINLLEPMRIRTAIALASAVSVAALALPAQATPTARYYVRSHDASLRADVGMRHAFEHGFSADLTQAQASSLAARGVELEPMVQYTFSGQPAGKGKPAPVRRTVSNSAIHTLHKKPLSEGGYPRKTAQISGGAPANSSAFGVDYGIMRKTLMFRAAAYSRARRTRAGRLARGRQAKARPASSVASAPPATMLSAETGSKK